MARTWLSIRVELVSGRGEDYWPRPGRILAAARSHTFEQLGAAIDLAFARWDLAHLRLFTLADQTPVCSFRTWGDMPDGAVDSDRTTLSRLTPGNQFAYVFDMGDDWTHLRTVADHRIDPLDQLGLAAAQPTPYQGWGNLTDQYGHRWDGDNGTPAPRPPSTPWPTCHPSCPWWGPHRGSHSRQPVVPEHHTSAQRHVSQAMRRTTATGSDALCP